MCWGAWQVILVACRWHRCDACCFLWARGAAGGWSQEMRVPSAGWACLVCMQDAQGCCELCAWNKTTLYPYCCLPCSRSHPGFAAAPGRLLSWPRRRRCPCWVGPELRGQTAPCSPSRGGRVAAGDPSCRRWHQSCL